MLLLLLLTTFLTQTVLCGPKFMSNGSMLKINAPNCMLWINEPIANFDGTLRVDHESFGRVVAQTVQFDRGIIRTDLGAEFYYTGTFNFNYYNQMFLTDASFIYYKAGLATKAIVVMPNSTASVIGSPEFMFDVSLTDPSSTLILGLQKKMETNLILNGGTVILKDDLRFKDGCRILGGGIIDINHRTLHIPGGDFANSPLTFYNASGVFFDSDSLISQPLTFKGANTTSKITANSFTITLGEGGAIILPDNNSRLEITNLLLKDLDPEEETHETSHFDINPTSTMVFQDCTIELSSDFNHTKGTIEFRDGCKIIHQGYYFNVLPGAFIVLNGASLAYDSLNKIDRNPFVFHDINRQKIVVNDGEIRSSAANPPLVLDTGNFVLHSDYILTTQSPMLFKNPTPDLVVTTTANFNGHSLTFPLLSQPVLKISTNVELNMLDTELFDYNQNCVEYGNNAAKLNFGNGVKIKLLKTETITPGHRPWNIVGNVTIGGKGSPLVLDGTERIIIKDNATLNLQDLRIVLTQSNSLKMLGNNSKIIFSNCSIVLHDGVEWTIDIGDIEVDDCLNIFGGKPSSSITNSTMTFSSSGQLLVHSNSTLKLGKNVLFKYQANPINDGGSVYASKRHFVLQDSTSVLELDGCVLQSTLTGFALDYGRVVVNDSSHLQIDGSNGTEAEIGSAVDFYIKPSMAFTFTGTLTYNQTALP